MMKLEQNVYAILEVSVDDLFEIISNLPSQEVIKEAFIGDAQLYSNVSLILSKKYTKATVKDLHFFRTIIICNQTLARMCDQILKLNNNPIINKIYQKLGNHSKGTIIEALLYRLWKKTNSKNLKEKLTQIVNIVLEERHEKELFKLKYYHQKKNDERKLELTIQQENSILIDSLESDETFNQFLESILIVDDSDLEIEKQSDNDLKLLKNNENIIVIKDDDVDVYNNNKYKNNNNNEIENQIKNSEFIVPTQTNDNPRKNEIKRISDNLKINFARKDFIHLGEEIGVNWRSRKGKNYTDYFYSCCGKRANSSENNINICPRYYWKKPLSYHPGVLSIFSSRKIGGGIVPNGKDILIAKCQDPTWTCCSEAAEGEGCVELNKMIKNILMLEK